MEEDPLLRGEIAEMRKPLRTLKVNFVFVRFNIIFLRS